MAIYPSWVYLQFILFFFFCWVVILCYVCSTCIWVVFSFRSYQIKLKNIHICFCVNINFHFPWISNKEWDSSLFVKCMLNFTRNCQNFTRNCQLQLFYIFWWSSCHFPWFYFIFSHSARNKVLSYCVLNFFLL